jgi:hypothetical protein
MHLLNQSELCEALDNPFLLPAWIANECGTLGTWKEKTILESGDQHLLIALELHRGMGIGMASFKD